MGPYRCESWILGLSEAIHPQTPVIDYLRQKIDFLTPTDTQDFESKLEKSHVFRMKGRQKYVILIKKQNTLFMGVVWGETGSSPFVKHDCLFTFLKESKCLPRRI